MALLKIVAKSHYTHKSRESVRGVAYTGYENGEQRQRRGQRLLEVENEFIFYQ